MANEKLSYSEKLRHPKWQVKRLEIIKRDEATCQVCGDTETTLHVHHIGYGNDPWDVDDSLLITMCAPCHEEEEGLLRVASANLIRTLRASGFTSHSMDLLRVVLTHSKDFDWGNVETFNILSTAMYTKDLWEKAKERSAQTFKSTKG